MLGWRWLVPGAVLPLAQSGAALGPGDVAAAAAAVVTLMVFFRLATYPEEEWGKQGKLQTLTTSAHLVCLHRPNPFCPGQAAQAGGGAGSGRRPPTATSLLICCFRPSCCSCAGWPGSPAQCLTGPPHSPNTCGNWWEVSMGSADHRFMRKRPRRPPRSWCPEPCLS